MIFGQYPCLFVKLNSTNGSFITTYGSLEPINPRFIFAQSAPFGFFIQHLGLRDFVGVDEIANLFQNNITVGGNNHAYTGINKFNQHTCDNSLCTGMQVCFWFFHNKNIAWEKDNNRINRTIGANSDTEEDACISEMS